MTISNHRNISIFVSGKILRALKYAELHRLIRRNGWVCIRISGSHHIYEKNGFRYPVPFHGSKEVTKGLEMKIRKEMDLK